MLPRWLCLLYPLYLYCLHTYLAMAEYETADSFDIPMSEDLVQYRVTENYTKMDSQQVDLSEGHIVQVIERFDTGKGQIDHILKILSDLCCQVTLHLCLMPMEVYWLIGLVMFVYMINGTSEMYATSCA